LLAAAGSDGCVKAVERQPVAFLGFAWGIRLLSAGQPPTPMARPPQGSRLCPPSPPVAKPGFRFRVTEFTGALLRLAATQLPECKSRMYGARRPPTNEKPRRSGAIIADCVAAYAACFSCFAIFAMVGIAGPMLSPGHRGNAVKFIDRWSGQQSWAPIPTLVLGALTGYHRDRAATRAR
jgi:hypothetical protein